MAVINLYLTIDFFLFYVIIIYKLKKKRKCNQYEILRKEINEKSQISNRIVNYSLKSINISCWNIYTV